MATTTLAVDRYWTLPPALRTELNLWLRAEGVFTDDPEDQDWWLVEIRLGEGVIEWTSEHSGSSEVRVESVTLHAPPPSRVLDLVFREVRP